MRLEMKNINAFPGEVGSPNKTSQVVDRVCLTLVDSVSILMQDSGVMVSE